MHAAIKCLHIPQGPSLRFGLSCPDPSSLNRPHPPHSRAHRDFAAWRLIRDAFAVRERLGDPRVVPGFRCPFFPDMPSSATPGSSTSIRSRQRCRHRPSPKEQRLGTPKIPAIRFTRGEVFEASTVHTFATACQFARHPVRIWPVSQPTAPFTSKLSTGQSPFPLLDMTTASTGLLCWWDSHPLEWQLASLHAPHLPDADRPSHATLTARPETSQLPVRSFCT